MARETTKSKILSSAVEIFAERGFAASTVSQICKRAKANIAAVNYHFGSKDALFEQAIEEAFTVAEQSYPLEASDGLAPEEQLRSFMRSIISRVFDDGPAGRIDDIIYHEVSRPDGPNPLILLEIQKRQSTVVRKILGRLLNTRSERLINQAHSNVAALCAFLKIAKPLRNRVFPKPPTPVQLDQYVEGQIAFALAGLGALKTTLSTK